ncbi:MAG TPA: sulfurtransferase TusA family protein [Spirochaetia bacterium]|nr:sulfurtransferase TusA family protein [Spirochaetia bacterium]
MAEHDAVKVLDYKGLACPMPVVKISQEIGKIEVGQVVEVNTTDPGSLSDFPAWAKSSGHEIVETKQEKGIIRIFVRRKK